MSVTCNRCGGSDYRVEQSGPHLKAICNPCNTYIKFLPQNNFTGDTVMFYGIHKGKPLKEIPKEYFVWLYKNTKVNGSLKTYIESTIICPIP